MSLDRLAPSLVQVSTGMPLIPSWIDAEQVSVRGCPAISKRLKGVILTVGGEGTAERTLRLIHTYTCFCMVLLIQHPPSTITKVAPSPTSLTVTKLDKQ